MVSMILMQSRDQLPVAEEQESSSCLRYYTGTRTWFPHGWLAGKSKNPDCTLYPLLSRKQWLPAIKGEAEMLRRSHSLGSNVQGQAKTEVRAGGLRNSSPPPQALNQEMNNCSLLLEEWQEHGESLSLTYPHVYPIMTICRTYCIFRVDHKYRKTVLVL